MSLITTLKRNVQYWRSASYFALDREAKLDVDHFARLTSHAITEISHDLKFIRKDLRKKDRNDQEMNAILNALTQRFDEKERLFKSQIQTLHYEIAKLKSKIDG